MARNIHPMDQEVELFYQKESMQIGGETKMDFSPNVSFASSRKMTHDLEIQHKDNEDEHAARKSLNELVNNDITKTKLATASRKEYKLLVEKG
eukprot:1972798-Ditylum_brightwellii.AAC.1